MPAVLEWDGYAFRIYDPKNAEAMAAILLKTNITEVHRSITCADGTQFELSDQIKNENMCDHTDAPIVDGHCIGCGDVA